MLHRALVLLSLACCTLVLVSFAMFARDQAAGASAHQQNELASGTAVAPAGSSTHAQPRRFIDGTANSLTAPFASVVHSSNPWVEHGVPALIALVVYGVGIGFVARFSSGRA